MSNYLKKEFENQLFAINLLKNKNKDLLLQKHVELIIDIKITSCFEAGYILISFFNLKEIDNSDLLFLHEYYKDFFSLFDINIFNYDGYIVHKKFNSKTIFDKLEIQKNIENF